MDSSQTFAQALLDQLRRDLRRFALGRLYQVNQEIGRSAQYIEKVEPENLRLEDAFAVIRILGFKPSEYLDRVGRASRPLPSSWIPPSPLGFFKRRGCDRGEGLRHLGPLLDWGYRLTLDEGAGPCSMDLQSVLESVGLEISPHDSLDYVDMIFSTYSSYGPGAMPERSLRDLIGSLLLAIEVLRQAEQQKVACSLLDLAFYLEGLFGDLDLRQRLFAVGGRICVEMGHPVDGIWCLREASLLALLVPDYEQARSHELEAADLADEHEIQGMMEPGRFRSLSEGAMVDGDRDLSVLLDIMASDRAASPLPAGVLDQKLGAQKAFAKAKKRRGPMSLERWSRFLSALNLPAEAELRRLDLLHTTPPRMGGFMQALKLPGRERPFADWQPKLLKWAKEVSITETVADHPFLAAPCWAAASPAVFDQLCQALTEFSCAFPSRLSLRDGEKLSLGLFAIAHVLRIRNQLNSAADLMDSAFFLQDRLVAISSFALAYRNASALALDLGDMGIAKLFLRRAKAVDIQTWDPQGLLLTLFREGVLAQISATYEVALTIHEGCLEPAREHGGLPPEAFYLSIARTHLLLGDHLEAAIEAIAQAEPSVILDDCFRGNFLWSQAACLSLSGREQEPLELLDRASCLFAKAENATELALVEIEKCRHYLRFGLVNKARDQGVRLLTLASKLERNPIGRAAILEMVRRSFSAELDLDSIQNFMHRVRYPNLSRKAHQPHGS